MTLTRAERHSRAVAICRRCPVISVCADWVAALPEKQRPGGVVAGQQPRGGTTDE